MTTLDQEITFENFIAKTDFAREGLGKRRLAKASTVFEGILNMYTSLQKVVIGASDRPIRPKDGGGGKVGSRVGI